MTPEIIREQGVNRRGRSLEVQVTVSSLVTASGECAGAILVMDVVGPDPTGTV